MNLAEEIKLANISPDSLGVWWLGMAGFVFKTPMSTTILVDPYLSNFVPDPPGWMRHDRCPLDPTGLITEYVLFTHDDFDHLDQFSVTTLANSLPGLTFIGPTVCFNLLREWGIPEGRIVRVEIGQTADLGLFQVSAVFALHGPGSVGLVIDYIPGKVYLAGDTQMDKRLLDGPKKLDVIVLPITPAGSHITIEEAAELTASLEPITVIPCHFGSIDVFNSSPTEFIRALRTRRTNVIPMILEPGQRYDLPVAGL